MKIFVVPSVVVPSGDMPNNYLLAMGETAELCSASSCMCADVKILLQEFCLLHLTGPLWLLFVR